MQDEKNKRHWLEYTVWRPQRRFIPPTDVIELPEKVIVVVEIAALRSSDLNITLLDDRLVIAGTRERPPLENAAYHQVEIGYGDFRVEIVLHWSVKRDGVSATYRDGLLQVELPRLPENQIAVQDGNSKES
jgi:HSP20 family protein